MAKTALFVDLANFYTQLIKSGVGDTKNVRNYFMKWFDFSSLSKVITGDTSNVWIFYSRERLGSKDAAISDNYLKDLISRFNSQKGITARNVNIKGEQREPYSIKCEKCNHQTEAEWKSEKGIDSSLIVHLFDTMDSWDIAILLSGDADYVPAVTSLRRQGKIVKGAGFLNKASSALIRECFEYINIDLEFIIADFACYELSKEDGLFWNYITEVHPKPKNNDDIEVKVCRVENEITGELTLELTSSRNRDLTKSGNKSNFLSPLIGIKSGTKHTNQEITLYYEFNSHFSEVLRHKLLFLLAKTDFGGWRTYYRYPEEHKRVEESEIIFRWNTKEKKYEPFYRNELEPQTNQN